MINKLRQYLGLSDTPDDDEEELGVPLAAAVLLLEVAWADHEIEPGEIDTIATVLKSEYRLDQTTLDDLMVQARELHRESTGLFPFTRVLVEGSTREERLAVLEHLWRLAKLDGRNHRYEEHSIRKVVDLLYLNHSDFIAAKRAASEA